MRKTVKYSTEVRERAVRMVRDHAQEYPTRWAAVESIAGKIGARHRRCRTGFARQSRVDAYTHIRHCGLPVKGLPTCACTQAARSEGGIGHAYWKPRGGRRWHYLDKFTAQEILVLTTTPTQFYIRA